MPRRSALDTTMAELEAAHRLIAALVVQHGTRLPRGTLFALDVDLDAVLEAPAPSFSVTSKPGTVGYQILARL